MLTRCHIVMLWQVLQQFQLCLNLLAASIEYGHFGLAAWGRVVMSGEVWLLSCLPAPDLSIH
jgi:hypothetical protein